MVSCIKHIESGHHGVSSAHCEVSMRSEFCNSHVHSQSHFRTRTTLIRAMRPYGGCDPTLECSTASCIDGAVAYRGAWPGAIDSQSSALTSCRLLAEHPQLAQRRNGQSCRVLLPFQQVGRSSADQQHPAATALRNSFQAYLGNSNRR